MEKKGLVFCVILCLAIIGILFFVSGLAWAAPNVLEKEEYVLGESVKIDLSDVSEYDVKMTTPSTTYALKGEQDAFVFKPEEVGHYVITVELANETLHFSFDVVVSETPVSVVMNDSSPPHVFVDSNNTGVGVENTSVVDMEIEEKMDDFLIRVGEPVKWTLIEEVDSEKVKIKLPVQAENISVYSVEGVQKVQLDFEEETPYLENLWTRVVSLNSEAGEKRITLEDAKGEVEIEYFTPGPELEANPINATHTQVTISSPTGLHYEHVLARIPLEELTSREENIEVYWKTEDMVLDYTPIDSDGNGLFDAVEWVVPHLSDQTFDVSVETDADLIDFNFEGNNSFYSLDRIRFNMEHLGNYEITIDGPSTHRNRVGSNDFFVFVPPRSGIYTVRLRRGGGETVFSFMVIGRLIQGPAEIGKPVRWTREVNGTIEEFFTEAPTKAELQLSARMKRVVVSSPPNVSYQNVWAYTSVAAFVKTKSQVRVYWVEENSYVDFEVNDSDADGFIDFVSWIVPHLSDQTFEIILITKADHLDENRNFVDDVYPQVSKLDEVRAAIPANHYVRVAFERNLTNEKDITIYARSFDNARVEVYEKNENDLIADFGTITGDQKYRVVLSNLVDMQDTFDLKVVGGTVEFDFIIDPPEDSGVIVFNDTFTDTTGDNLFTQHTPNVGTAWTEIFSSGSDLEINTNQLDASGSTNDGSIGYAGISGAWKADQMAKVRYAVQDSGDDYSHLVVRADATMANAYVFSFSTTATNTYLWKAVGGVNSNLNTSCGADNQFTTGDVVSLKVVGTRIQVFDGNTLVCSVTDASIVSGQPGAGLGESPDDSAGDVDAQRLDDFVAYVFNRPPSTPNVSINSSDGLNSSYQNLNCFTTLIDPDNESMNLTVRWYQNGTLNRTIDFNNTYVNGTSFLATLASGNLSVGFNWSCGVTTYDGYNYSYQGNSSQLPIIALPTPVIHIISPLIQNYTTTTVQFNVSTSVLGSWCGFSLDSAANITMTKFNSTYYNYTNSSMGQGSHTIRFSCNNSDGIMNSTTVRTFGVDNLGPQVTLVNPQNTTYATSSIPFNFTLSEAGSCNYTLNGGATNYTMTANSSSTGFNATNTSIADGSYTVRAYCWDLLFNTNFTETRTFSKDTTAPVVNITYPLNTSYSRNVSELNYTVSDPTKSLCWYSTNGGATNSSTVSAGTNFTGVTSSEGSNTWIVYCNDTVGNQNFSRLTFFKDTIGPTIVFNSPLNSSSVADVSPTLNVTVSETVSRLWYTIDDGAINTTICLSCTGAQTKFLFLREGNFLVRVYANDTFGAIGANSSNFTINMSYNYYDSFNDNSSFLTYTHNVTWQTGNISFIGISNMFFDRFETDLSKWGTTGGWTVAADRANTGASSAKASNGAEGLLRSTTMNTTGVNWINVTFAFNEDDLEDTDIDVYFYDGTSYDLIDTFGADQGTEDTWYTVSYLTTDSQYFISNFSVGFDATLGAGENVWIDDMVVNISRSGNFTAYAINTTATITQIVNATWTEDNTDTTNNITVQLSADAGSTWYATTKGQGFSLTSGTSLIYKVFFNTNNPRRISLLDFNITWTDAAPVVPSITINSPLNTSTVKDVTPILNVSLGSIVSTLWYTTNNGTTNVTICVACSGTQTTFLHLSEGVHTVKVYANDSANLVGTNSTRFTIDMNYSYYDTYDDNSSILSYTPNVTWQTGNISFIGISNMFFDRFETDLSKWGTTGGWTVAADRANTGASSAKASNGAEGLLRSTTMNTTGVNWINVTFAFNEDDLEDTDIDVYFYDGTSYDLIDTFGADQGTEDTWYTVSYLTTDSQYFISNFSVGFDATLGAGENVWIDDMVVNISRSGNFTAYVINTTSMIRQITNITWTEDNTDTTNNITVQLSANHGINWTNVSKGRALTSIVNGTGLIYRVLFNTNDPKRISLLDLKINWTNVEPAFINIVYPLNTSYSRNVSELNYTVAGGSLSACWYTLNGGATNTTITCGANVTGLTSSQGSNTWTVYVNNTNNDVVSSTVTFFKDTIAPNVSLTSPSNGSVSTSSTILFNWTALDNLDTSLLCNLTLDSTLLVAHVNATNGTSTTYTAGAVSEGNHLWNVSCVDNLWNLNRSLTYSFTITLQTTLLQIIKGNGTTAGATTDVIISPPLSNISKAFHFVTYRHSIVNDHANTFKSSEIINTTLLRIYGDTSGGVLPVNFSYSIVEFTSDSPLVVQRDNITTTTNDPAVPITKDLLITVNASEAFLIYEGHTHRANDAAFGSEELDMIRLLNDTTWEYNVADSPNTNPQNNRIEVVHWDDDKFMKLVQRGNVSLGAAATSMTITPTITVNPNKTMLFINFMEGTGSAGTEPPNEVGVFANLSKTGTILIERQTAGPELLIAWELVEFQPGALNVYQVKADFSSGQLAGNFTIPQSVLTNRTVAFGTSESPFGHSGATSSDTTGGAIDRNTYTIDLTNSTNVLAVRQVSTGSSSLGIQVVEFTKLPAISNVNATSITTTSATITWDTDSIANSTVYYSTNSFNLNNTQSDNSFVVSHGIPLSGLTSGTLYFYNVSSCNSNGCTSSGIYNFTTSTVPAQAPVVYLVNPASSTIQNSSTIILYYNTTDANGDFANSTLILNGQRNMTNRSVMTGGIILNFTLTLFDGIYNWTVNVTDLTGLIGTNTSVRNFTIDTRAPNITLYNPQANESISQNSVYFNFTVTDNWDTNITCDLVVDSVVQQDDFGAINGTPVNYTKTIAAGTHFWNVTCIDDASNFGRSQTRNFTVTEEPPVVFLITANNSYTNTGNITLIYNVSDNNGLTRAQLVLNGQLNQTNQTQILNGQYNNFTLVNLANGVYTWTVNVTDTGGNNATNLSIRTFTVDKIKPTITLNFPTNASSTNSSTVSFNFTIIDNLDTSLTCNLTAGEKTDLNFAATNGSMTNRSLSGFIDGNKYWNVTCIDDAGNLNSSTTFYVTVTEYPSIALNTANNSFYNVSSLNLTYTPSDNTNLSRCELFIDGIFNQTNQSEILNGQKNNFSLLGINEGVHNWTVFCNDTFGLRNQSQTRIFTVDLDGLNITLLYPIDGANLFTTSVDFSFNATDNIDSSLVCNLTVDSIVVNSSTVTSGAITNRTIGFSDGGTKFWNVTCFDDSNNRFTSATRNFTLAFSPIVALNNPASGYIQNSSNITLYYEPSDDNLNIANATLILNGQRNMTNRTEVEDGQVNNFTLTLFDGFYTWTVNVTDLTGLIGTNTSVRNFTIDTHGPNITLSTPENNSIKVWNNITFNFTASDNLATNLVCALFVNGTSIRSGINVTNGSNSIAYIVLSDGTYNWSVSCLDRANNTGYSIVYNFSIEAPPNVTLVYPDNGSVLNSSTIQFRYIPEDAIGFSNCSIYIDDILNSTNDEPDNGIENSFTLLGIPDGNHNWTIQCTDASPDFNIYRAPVRYFTVDTIFPVVNLLLPLNNTNSLRTTTFNFTATDNLDDILVCNLTIDSVVNISQINVSNGTVTSRNVSRFVLGAHVWNVSCVDNAGNKNWSETWTFNVTLADLFVNASEIFLNESSVVENQSVLINATIRNLVNVTVPNVIVSFFDGNPLSGGVQIGQNQTISSLDPLGQFVVNVTWYADLGTSTIFVHVDPPIATNGSIEEWNETNNAANSTSTIGAWHFFVGDVDALSRFDLTERITNASVTRWLAANYRDGNLYVTDSESSISWPSLQAIGRNSTNANAFNDFADVDTLLNMTNYVDSVSALYTNGTDAINLGSYLVFQSNISNVSSTNSTNNTNFLTGILWDKSDDIGDGGYSTDDVEDLVFITKIQRDAAGKYGVYDYELRIPARLREYKKVELKEVVFYVELR